MLRSFKLHCALGTLALACGGSTDDDLFGNATDVQTGGSSAGGRATASGGTSPSPTGGSATVAGGRASGSGGAGTAQGGEAESGSGGASAGLSGMGGSPNEGGAEPGGGTSTGGTANASGGAPNASGGAPTASGGSGDATGGTVSASGGVVSGGSGGGSGGSASGKGGSDGMVTCQEARAAVNAALEAAQACDNNQDDQCLGFVDGECCPVPVNDPSSTEAETYQAALTKMHKVCGVSICPAVLCVEPKQAVCESKGSGSGRCAAKSILSM